MISPPAARRPNGSLICVAILYLVLGLAALLLAEAGKPFATYYTAIETGGHTQNWAFSQDQRGVIYVGNGYGIQEFDGSTWRLIRITNGSFVRSFACDSSGRIYVGSATEFGYLDADSTGLMGYHSLLSQLAPEECRFNYVWSTHVTPQGIYFQARERLFRLETPEGVPAVEADRQGDKAARQTWRARIWRPDEPEHYYVHSWYLDGTLFVLQRGRGLMKMAGDSLILVPGSEQFISDRSHILLPFPGRPGVMLLGTLSRGLFLFDGQAFTPWVTAVDPLLKQGGLYSAANLPDGSLALGTLSQGLFIIDNQGALVYHLTKSAGLLSNTVSAIFVDQQKNIWLGMAGGVGTLEYQSDLEQFPFSSGGVPFDLRRHRGILYASATDGVYYLDRSDSQFKFVAGMKNSGPSNLLVVGEHLYVGTVTGVYLIHGTDATLALPYDAATPAFVALARSRRDPGRIMAGAINGLAALRYDSRTPEHLRMEGIIPGIHQYIRQICEPEPGLFWLSTYNSGIIRLKFSRDDLFKPQIDLMGPEQGVPAGITSVYHLQDRLVFGTSQGIYRFDQEQGTFLPDSFFSQLNLGINPGECAIARDVAGNLWANAGRETACYRKTQDGYRLEKGAASRFADELLYTIYPDDNGAVWFGTTRGAIRLRAGARPVYFHPFQVLIRRVVCNGDSALYWGGSSGDDTFTVPLLPYRRNALSFEFAATSYYKPADNEYRSRLEGFDAGWSAWSREAKRVYTNLPQGRYRFHVVARNVYGQESSEASFPFIILPPWYQSWWAWLIYIITAGGVIYGIVAMRTQRLHRRGRHLENIVQQRTAEIQEQKDHVEKLSLIGQDITNNLSIVSIVQTVYDNVNKLIDAPVLGIGLRQEEKNSLEFPATIENGKTLPPFSYNLADENRLAVLCYRNLQEVIINDLGREYKKYIDVLQTPMGQEMPESVLYLPLQHKGKVIGVITAQSFRKNAYTAYDINIFRNLAAYCANALQNAESYRRLIETLEDLKKTQERLVTSSKLAALGALTAGIAHEIKNPLNFVNNFSELSIDLVQELRDLFSRARANPDPDVEEEIEEVLATLQQNSAKIREHGKRADSIVRSMLQHSRGTAGERQLTNINAMVEEDINLAYHGMRAQDSSFNIKIEKELDPAVGQLEVVPQEISRVVLNILTNGCYETNRRRQNEEGGYQPVLQVRTKATAHHVEIRIRDNGGGIPEAIKEKLFTPFFTTKPAGQGTGLGLSISYDIVVHGHGGQLLFESEPGEGTEFIIRLPKK